MLASLAGCLGDDDDDDDADDGDDAPEDPEELADQYLSDNDANLYDGSIEDMTGEDQITIDVGADDGLAFEPPAVRVDTGTTVVWEWTGEGGNHNVAPDGPTQLDGFGQSDTTDEAGHTVEDTFDEAGAALYVCSPHAGQNMYGAVIVE